MKKLNLKEIRWILKELKRGKISVYQIAKLQKVSPRWVRQLPKKYAGIYPYKIRILKCGRKPKEIPEEERKLILDVKKDNPVGPVKLEILLKKRGIRMPHNKIYKILKEAGLIKEQKNKQKQRKYIRYERRNSNSPWHGDWFESDEGEQVLLLEDDASR